MNLPNKLTLLRILLVPVFIVLELEKENYWALGVFAAAALTDMFDGMIARKYHLITSFGKLMDPLADKILTMSAFICLVQLGHVAGWMVIVILAREFIVTGLRTVAASDGIVIAAGWSGKIKTVLQMTAIILILLNNWPFYYLNIPMDQIVLWAAVLMTVISGAEYMIKNKNLLTFK